MALFGMIGSGLAALNSACGTQGGVNTAAGDAGERTLASPSSKPGLPGVFATDALESPRQQDRFFKCELASYTSDQWTEVKTEGEGDDRIILSRVNNPVSDLPVAPVQARTMIHAPFDKVLAVYIAAERNMEWADPSTIKTIDVLQSNRKDRFLIYSRVKGVYPVADRDYYLESRVRVSPEQKLVESVSLDVPGPSTDAVRMKRLENQWLLRAVGPNTTELTIKSISNPGGSLTFVPSAVINHFAQDVPIELVNAFRKQVLTGTGYEGEQARVRTLWPALFASG